MTFWSCKKNCLIRKIILTSKFMTSQPGEQTIRIPILPNFSGILPNISRSKNNQTLKLGQLIEYNKKNIFIRKLYTKWAREASSRPLFVFLWQFLTTESPLKIMKNAFYFTSKPLFVLRIFKVFFKFLISWSCRKTAWLER